MIQVTLTLKMTTAQVVETSVTVNNISPIQDSVHPDGQTQPTFEMTPGFKPFTVLKNIAKPSQCHQRKRMKRNYNYIETILHYYYFKSRLSLIVRMNVVLNRTVVVDSDWRFDNLCGSHLQSQSSCVTYYTPVIDLIGQLRRDVIGRLSVKMWCYWLWRLVISNWCVSISPLSHINSHLLLVKLSFSRS